jgi:hypothetical protein
MTLTASCNIDFRLNLEFHLNYFLLNLSILTKENPDQPEVSFSIFNFLVQEDFIRLQPYQSNAHIDIKNVKANLLC